ncbi:MAG: aminomethyl-transferring glycine dehydrogenase subunit GcvPA [Myxococcota bacterium]
MRYIPHTPDDVARMLRACGAASVEELFAGVPKRLRLARPLALPPALSEPELAAHLGDLAARNVVPTGRANSRGNGEALAFLGAGVHRHLAPAAQDLLLLRAEFYTSYTPYQPEISQGTLQATFEFQTIVAELFGLDVANASLYDGASAAAEAALMARRATGRPRVVVSAGLHPEYRACCDAYLRGLAPDGSLVTVVPVDASGATDLKALDRALSGDVACVIAQSPNFFGVIEDLEAVAKRARAHGAMSIGACAEPVALGLIRAPGEADCDIAIGEGLGLCGHTSLGGPGVGLFATRSAHVRSMPGRLVGETVDAEGRRGYVLTLATREQHIRREKATSNICTNQGLMALAFTINACLLGRRGLRELAEANLAIAEYAKARLTKIPGYALRFSGPTFNEFALRVRGGDAARVVQTLAVRGVVPGVSVGRFDASLRDTLLIGVSELHRKADIDQLAAALAEFQP